MVYKLFMAIILFVLFFSSCSSQTSDAAFTKNLDEQAEKAITEKHIPSLAIGIVKDNEVVYAKVFGFSDVEEKKRATPQSYYQLGSVTKTITGHVLARLVEQNEISLSDPAADFFPKSVRFSTGSQGEVVTIQHLATHTSGFPRYPENLERIDPDPIMGYSKEKLYEGIGLVELSTTPGSEFDYSNFGYGVLGTALENATGKSLSELMKIYVFEPAGMKTSALFMNEEVGSGITSPYLEVDPYEKTEPWQMESLAGAGNVFSNLDDMNNFLIYLLGNTSVNALQQTAIAGLEGNENWKYGLGCFVVNQEEPKTKRIHHGGDVDGYASTINLYPEYGLGMVVMTNNGDSGLLGDVFSDIRRLITSHYMAENQ